MSTAAGHGRLAPDLRFRRAGDVDVAALVALVESAYRGDASRQGWTTEADLLDGQRIDAQGIAEALAAADSRIVLVERDGELLGCAHLQRGDGHAYFGMFAVRPQLQGGGIGGALLEECERIAREELGCVRIAMTVISLRDELIAWYERRGYRRSGRYKAFPYGDARFGLPRRDDLRFEWLDKPLAPVAAPRPGQLPAR